MKGSVHVHVEPKVEKHFIKSLERAGIKYDTIEQDIQR